MREKSLRKIWEKLEQFFNLKKIWLIGEKLTHLFNLKKRWREFKENMRYDTIITWLFKKEQELELSSYRNSQQK